MDNSIVVSHEDLQNVVARLRERVNRISDVFEKQKNNFERINATDIWSGLAQDACFAKHYEVSAQFSSIIESLNKYVNFLEKVSIQYIEIDNYLENKVDVSF